ncbi:Asp23/Gls24 family envelope stress response protein [Anaerovorax odorimutans]|uniref:Asp23/Gls24 family envelope stress response protein n=1 Tax=Anaerovorax odorimutans TaxID=109327 RepID=A0ABT1RL24_9FIRM|nr:Asp23/Gls24 family envelope stress response protein [Anaerovorax odorimutans]MCQ4635886.1 Asp23/Gls24 family envelope stress response protein [Anaerovorax odorimutans]
MNVVNEQKSGTLKISDEVIAVCAANAALKTKGVAELAGGLTNALSKNFLGKELLYKGVKVSQGDDGVIMDIFVIVDYQVNIPAVAWDIQEHVKKEVESMTEMTVEAVNINVQGVHIPEEEAPIHD